MQALYEKYEGKLMVITWLGETADGATPDESGLNDWIDEYGITHIVGSGWGSAHDLAGGGGLGLPSMNLIAPGGEVVIGAAWVQESDIAAVLPE